MKEKWLNVKDRCEDCVFAHIKAMDAMNLLYDKDVRKARLAKTAEEKMTLLTKRRAFLCRCKCHRS